jgi:hypothetical protein
VVHLRNAVLEEGLQDDELYAELVDDVLTECGTYGDVDAVEIPRPDGDNKHEAQGSIFVRFGDELFAEQAIEAFADRSLNGKTILAGYYPEDLFKEKRFDSTPLPPVEAPQEQPASSEPAPTILAAQAVAAGVAGIGGVASAAAPPIVLAPPPPPPNGAGRGVDNRPAWMTETQQAPPPAPPAPVDDMD